MADEYDLLILSLRSSLFRFLLAGEARAKGKSRERMGREQKEEREGGVGEERKSLQLSPYILPNAVRPRTGGN